MGSKTPTNRVGSPAVTAWEALPETNSLVFDAELRYVVAPGPALALHGFTSTDREGHPAASTLPQQRWKGYEPLYRDALKGETRSIEISLPDGKRRCLVRVGPLLGDHGDIVGGVALAVDTTALGPTEVQYRAMLEATAEAMILVSPEGIIRYASSECERLFGYTHGELVGSTVEMLLPERFRDPHREERATFVAAHDVRRMGASRDLWGRRKDGGEFPVEVGLTTLDTDGGTLVGAVIRDIEAERRTAESLILLETLQSAAPVGMVFVDRELRVRRINETLAATSSLPMEDQIGRLVADVVPEIWPQLEPIFTQVLCTGEAVVNQTARLAHPRAPGQALSFLSSFYPVRVRGEVVGVGVVAVDITEREQAEEFRETVMESLAEGLYVVDRHGRLAYMNPAASRMLGYSELELAGQPMHETIHFQHPDGTPFPAAECEICLVRSYGRLVRTATNFTRKDGTVFPVAYSAAPLGGHAGGRGVVVAFHDTTKEEEEEARARRELDMMVWVGRTRDALDDDRLVLYSQPIVPLGDDEPCEELLVRMLGRDGEVIAPGSFLPAAERYGLIGEIDRWVIAQAVRAAADGRHVHVHANLSADSIANLDLLPLIEREILETGADPAKIGFEITETALIGDIEAGEAFARGLANLGCSLSLDDFGTGFGSFTYLQRLPFTYLKIDIAFVRDLPSNQANQQLVKGIINLARGFGLRTIAEGVESAETLELLREYGADFVQGYHLGRPAPIA